MKVVKAGIFYFGMCFLNNSFNNSFNDHESKSAYKPYIHTVSQKDAHNMLKGTHISSTVALRVVASVFCWQEELIGI